MAHSFDRTRTWSTWAGTKDGDFRRLGAVVNELADSRVKPLLREYDDATYGSADMADDDDDTLVGQREEIQAQVHRERRELGRARLNANFETTVTLVHGNDKTTGPMDDMLNELDRRTLNSATFSAGAGCDKIELTFIRERFPFGVALHVVSSDIGWVNQVLSRVGGEVERGRPKSYWLRSKVGRGLISFTTPLTIIGAIFAVLYPEITRAARPEAVRLSLAVSVMATFWFLIFDQFHDWLMPRFEILNEGSNSSGIRHVGWMAAQVLATIVAIVAGIIATHISLNTDAIAATTAGPASRSRRLAPP